MSRLLGLIFGLSVLTALASCAVYTTAGAHQPHDLQHLAGVVFFPSFAVAFATGITLWINAGKANR